MTGAPDNDSAPSQCPLWSKADIGLVSPMSPLPPKADIRPRDQDVCFGPKADSCTAAKSVFTETSEGDVRICTASDFEAPSVFTLRFEGTEARYKVIWRNQQFVSAELAPQETSPVNP